MNKRVVAVMGTLLLGYLIKVFFENCPAITNLFCGLLLANPAVMQFVIGGLVICSAAAIMYGLIKLFLKWEDPDSAKSGSAGKH